MKITDKQIKKIIQLFCIIDERKYPYSTGIWGKDTELYNTDENKTALEKAIKDIRKILK